jgi:4-hydroxy-3-methylbut-2-enyl diphosphate reductase
MNSDTATVARMRQIVLAGPRGFCAGVDRAIDIVELALRVCPYPVYVRKEIVHNRHVVEALRAKGAHFVDELDEVPDGATVIFSAHGISPAVRAEAQRRGLSVIDATCPLVTKVHLEATRYAREGYSIILVGHADHDEVVGTMGEAPDRMFVIAHPDDVDRLDVPDPEKVAYLTQTTLSVDDTRDCIDALRRRFPRIVGPSKDDICYATQNRQVAVKAVASEVDVLLVIGAANSSNANRLVEVSRVMGTPSYLINDKNDVRPEWIEGAGRVGVTAGASTPEFLVSEVVEEVRRARSAEVREVRVVEEDVRFGLPRELEEMAERAGRALTPRTGTEADGG